MNNDTFPDLATPAFVYTGGGAGVGNVFVLLGDGLGAFNPLELFETGASGFINIDLADLDGDRNLDLTAGRYWDGNPVLFGDGADGYKYQTKIPSDYQCFFALEDLNNDGWPDVAMAEFENRQVVVYLNRSPF